MTILPYIDGNMQNMQNMHNMQNNMQNMQNMHTRFQHAEYALPQSHFADDGRLRLNPAGPDTVARAPIMIHFKFSEASSSHASGTLRYYDTIVFL
jgi:hypothetical protein